MFSLRNLILIILIVVGINYYKSTQEVDVYALSLPLDTKVLAFGDSLTYGYGVDKTQSYPAKLAEYLRSNVVNAGISGELSEQGLERLPALLESEKPDILVLCHGGNDILRQRDMTVLKNNLDKMIKLAHSKGIYVLLVGVPRYDVLRFSVPDLYYEVARENDVMLEDKSLKKILNDDSLKSDNVHPNAKGYDIMAQRIGVLLSENYHPLAKPF